LTTIETFVAEFVSIIRKATINKYFSDLFVSPCQISGFYNTDIKLLTMVMKHDPKEKDRISIFESDERKNIFEEAQKELFNAYWSKKGYLVELTATLGKLLWFTPHIKMKAPFYVSSGKFGAHKNSKVSKDGFFQCLVDPEMASPKDMLQKLLEHGRKRAKTEKITKINFLVGAVWYPLFVISDEPMTLMPKFVIKSKYKGYPILLNNHCFIFIKPSIKPPLAPFMNEAITCLNEIIGVAQIYGIEGSKIPPEDLLILEYDKKLERTLGFSLSPTPTIRSLLLFDFIRRPTTIFEFEKHQSFKRYEKAAILEVIKKANIIMKNQTVRDYVLSLLDAKTHLLIKEHKTSFLLSWVVLEKYIDDVWLEMLKSQEVTGKRFDKLAKSILWSADDKLETLNLLNVIENERYFEIIRLKAIRNKIIHEERKVTEREAKEVLQISTQIVKEIIRSRCFVE
jgi:hypothetical protein